MSNGDQAHRIDGQSSNSGLVCFRASAEIEIVGAGKVNLVGVSGRTHAIFSWKLTSHGYHNFLAILVPHCPHLRKY